MKADLRERTSFAEPLKKQRQAGAVVPMVSNRDLAHLAHLSEFGPGPICLSASDRDVYEKFIACGYVLPFRGDAFVTAAGREALRRWYETQVELPKLWGA